MHIQNDSTASTRAAGRRRMKGGMTLGLLLSLCAAAPLIWAEDPGVTSNNIRIGATLPWKGISKCTACR